MSTPETPSENQRDAKLVYQIRKHAQYSHPVLLLKQNKYEVAGLSFLRGPGQIPGTAMITHRSPTNFSSFYLSRGQFISYNRSFRMQQTSNVDFTIGNSQALLHRLRFLADSALSFGGRWDTFNWCSSTRWFRRVFKVTFAYSND
jgi:hypothetical protein